MQRKAVTYYFSFTENNILIFLYQTLSTLLTSTKFYIFLVATKRPRFSVPGTDKDQPRENVSVFERYRAQSHIPVPGPASLGEDQLEFFQNTTDTTGCEYCLQTRCITPSPFKAQARGSARINNHIKRRKKDKWYWRTLKDCGLWEDPLYQARKEQLGCHIDDVREVMPHWVIKDVRERWPNPPHIPYQGHRRA